MSEATALETAEANLNAAEQAGAEAQGQQQNQEGSANGAEPQSAANTDPYGERFSKLEQMLNRINSELGGTRKLRSEFDQFRQAQTQQTQTAPKSWAELDEPTQKATREILLHVLQEELGPKLKDYDTMHSTYQEQQSLARVGEMARAEFGDEFDKYNPVMGEIYQALKGMAANGSEDASKFLTELKTTDSAAYRLFGMARQKMSESVQAKNEQVTKQQEEKAKRASVGVGGSKVAPSNVDTLGLPKKGSEGRLEAMEAALDKAMAQRGR